MVQWFMSQGHVEQALISTLFTWLMTAAGAAMVFFFKNINKNIMNAMMGFAAGVMIAASFWSLLSPAVSMAQELGQLPWLVGSLGFLAGGGFLFAVDKLLPHMHSLTGHTEGVSSSWSRSVLLVSAVTLHNIPEGLAVGVAFGAVASGIPGASAASAVALAIGIGIQNFPEGAAVSIPMRREGLSCKRSFFFGQCSGMVEPMAGVLGAWLVMFTRPVLPFILAFAAGAMIYVVVEELIPESQLNKENDLATIGVMAGFAVMMVLDVALG